MLANVGIIDCKLNKISIESNFELCHIKHSQIFTSLLVN